MRKELDGAIEAVNHAKRMLDYATEECDIDNAVNLYTLAWDKLEFLISCNKKEWDIVANMDGDFINSIEPINENPKFLDSLRNKLRRLDNVKLPSKA